MVDKKFSFSNGYSKVQKFNGYNRPNFNNANSNKFIPKQIHSKFQNQSKNISKSLISSINSGAKRAALEDLDFVPAKRNTTYQLANSLKSKYTVLKPADSLFTGQAGQEVNGKSKLQKRTVGMPVPRVQISPEIDFKSTFWKQDIKARRLISTGLQNLGNTCFLNATLQVLVHTPALWNYLAFEWKNENKKSFYKHNNIYHGFNMLEALYHHQTFALKSAGQGGFHGQPHAIKPIKIIQGLQVIAKHMRIGRQEDAHEFLRYVLDAMQKSQLQQAKRQNLIIGTIEKECLHVKSTTKTHRIFGGYTRSRITCTICKNTSDCYDPFLDLQLDIKQCDNIMQSLHRFCKADFLTGSNQYKCSKCNMKRDATKKVSIIKPPQILTLQLKRFDLQGIQGMGKINRGIHYPAVLDIKSCLSEHNVKELKYNLYGIIVHSGHSCQAGHYYAYCKNSQNNWYCLNDSHITQVSPSTALHQSEAYLLFYNRITRIEQVSHEPSPMLPLKAKILQKQKEEAEKKERDQNENKMIGPGVHHAPKKRKVEEQDRKVKNPEKLPCPFPESKTDLEERTKWIKMDGQVVSKEATKPLTPSKRKRGLVDYDTESSSSTSSTGKNSRTPSKREKFLAKKASRLKALGNIDDDLSSKVQNATLNSPAVTKKDKKEKKNVIFKPPSPKENSPPKSLKPPSTPTSFSTHESPKQKQSKESLLDKPWVDDKKIDPDELAALKQLVGDYEKPIGPQPQDVQVKVGFLGTSTFLTKGCKSWEDKKSNHDAQIEKDVKNQKKSVFNRLDLEYDQERIEKYERKRLKVEKKQEQKRMVDRLGFAARDEFAARQKQNNFQKMANKEVDRVEFRSREELKKNKKDKKKSVTFNIS